jgi:hypothetical protein
MYKSSKPVRSKKIGGFTANQVNCIEEIDLTGFVCLTLTIDQIY